MKRKREQTLGHDRPFTVDTGSVQNLPPPQWKTAVISEPGFLSEQEEILTASERQRRRIIEQERWLALPYMPPTKETEK